MVVPFSTDPHTLPSGGSVPAPSSATRSARPRDFGSAVAASIAGARALAIDVTCSAVATTLAAEGVAHHRSSAVSSSSRAASAMWAASTAAFRSASCWSRVSPFQASVRITITSNFV